MAAGVADHLHPRYHRVSKLSSSKKLKSDSKRIEAQQRKITQLEASSVVQGEFSYCFTSLILLSLTSVEIKIRIVCGTVLIKQYSYVLIQQPENAVQSKI
jgi:hypothetical protein